MQSQKTYRRKTEEIYAYQYTFEDFEHSVETPGVIYNEFGNPSVYSKATGQLPVQIDDYIMRFENGNYFRMPAAMFLELYEAA